MLNEFNHKQVKVLHQQPNLEMKSFIHHVVVWINRHYISEITTLVSDCYKAWINNSINNIINIWISMSITTPYSAHFSLILMKLIQLNAWPVIGLTTLKWTWSSFSASVGSQVASTCCKRRSKLWPLRYLYFEGIYLTTDLRSLLLRSRVGGLIKEYVGLPNNCDAWISIIMFLWSPFVRK